MGALEKTRQELDATKVRLSSTQKCLHERDGHLNQLQQERRKQLEEILEMKLVTHDLFAFRHFGVTGAFMRNTCRFLPLGFSL